jgi:hypothetical protein
MTFPRDDYTPYGYLANPFHRARAWTDSEAGVLRTTDDLLGLGWLEPTARKPSRELAIAVMVRWNGRLYRTRADFARIGYRSRHHSAMLFSYDWDMDFVAGTVRFALAHRDGLVADVTVENRGPLPAECDVLVLGRFVTAEGKTDAQLVNDAWNIADARGMPTASFAVHGAVAPRPQGAADLAVVGANGDVDRRLSAGYEFPLSLGPGETWTVGVGLARAGTVEAASDLATRASGVCDAKRDEDDEFYASVALPVGDWPDAWRRGWIYDLETTRACIYPPGGIFNHEWLSWMIPTPRAVLAEGTLDAVRFSYASPERALGLVKTLFTSAPAANVPCVFQGGEPNMVAKDGTVCGTSPAWCLPFYNIWLLYLRTLDRPWLDDLVPRLEAFLEYWLQERTDEFGWIVYKCSYEAGEDFTPRLDPTGKGDDVISHVVRPVELQATFSQSATILAAMSRELGQARRSERWEEIARDYATRTQSLWDPAWGSYRDWDKRTNAFLVGTDNKSYWKTDPVRHSALRLTPLVAGIATPEQRERLREEIEHYDAGPWCIWPSWSYVVAEAASAAGWYDFAGRFAARIVNRVYRANDRRTLAEAGRPLPGTAPEFWALDLADFHLSDGYGWGATTTSLWVRQIFGFREGRDPARFSFTLTPNLPEEFLRRGRRFGFTQLPYRGHRFDVAYEFTDRGLEATIESERAWVDSVHNVEGVAIQVETDTHGVSRFTVQIGQRLTVTVREIQPKR